MSQSTVVQVGVVMGSSSDWDVMQHAVAMLKDFGIRYEAQVISAHRMPDQSSPTYFRQLSEPIPVQERAISLDEQAQDLIQQSLQQSARLLTEGMEGRRSKRACGYWNLSPQLFRVYSWARSAASRRFNTASIAPFPQRPAFAWLLLNRSDDIVFSELT